MTVITISHQIGSHGREIGQAVAEKLNLDYIDRQIVQAAAARLGIPEESASAMDEKSQSALQRVLGYLSAGAMSLTAPLVLDNSDRDAREYHEATIDIIEAAARTNRVVIAGHGANFALADHPDTLNVFIYAPEDSRIATVAARENIGPEAATRSVRQNDHDRDQYIKNNYGKVWHNYHHYQLMLNTGVIPPELAVQLIAEVAQQVKLSSSSVVK